MTDLVSLFKEKAEEFLASINQKGGVRATIEGLRRQMAEADRRRAIGRVKAELRRLDGQINEMVTAVGVQAVALQEAGQLSSPELQPLCQHIIDLRAALGQQQAELAKLEAAAGGAPVGDVRVCPNCGKPVPPGGTFCPYCGAAIVPGTPSAPGTGSAPGTTPGATVASAEPRTGAARPQATASEEALPPQAAPARPATCAYCGAPLKPGARFCSKCGRAV